MGVTWYAQGSKSYKHCYTFELKLIWLYFHFQDKRNFVRSPPAGVDFTFDYETSYPVAMATLAEDSNLETMRFELVPKVWVIL